MLRGAIELVRRRGRNAPARTPAEIDADIADEIASHLAMRERSFVEAGLDVPGARRLARHRFGDIDRVTTRCRRIAMEEQVMMQRVNAVLTVVLLLAVAALGVQLVRSQQATRATLTAIDARLAAIQSVTAGSRQPAPSHGDAGAAPLAAVDAERELVYVAGDIGRPGTYELPPGSLTTKRLLVAAGVDLTPGNEYKVTIRAADQPDEAAPRESLVIGDAVDPAGANDPRLRPGDLVEVRRVDRQSERDRRAAEDLLARTTPELIAQMNWDQVQGVWFDVIAGFTNQKLDLATRQAMEQRFSSLTNRTKDLRPR